MGLLNQFKVLRTKTGFQKKDFCFKTVTQKSCLSFQPLTQPYRFQTCQPSLLCEPIPQNKSLSFSIHLYIHPISSATSLENSWLIDILELRVALEEQNLNWFFWIGSEVPGISSLIWLDLNALVTIYSGRVLTIHGVMWQYKCIKSHHWIFLIKYLKEARFWVTIYWIP